jgi:hypothetical protein
VLSKECQVEFKEQLIISDSCTDKKNSLYYYKQYNLDTNEEEGIRGGFEELRFDVQLGLVYEVDKNMKLVNSFDTYDISLKSDENSEWLEVAGINTANQILNKRYFVNIRNNAACMETFENIQNNILRKKKEVKLANNNEYLFWVPRTNVEVINGNSEFLLKGKLKIRANQVFIADEFKPVDFVDFKLHNNILTLERKELDIPLNYRLSNLNDILSDLNTNLTRIKNLREEKRKREQKQKEKEKEESLTTLTEEREIGELLMKANEEEEKNKQQQKKEEQLAYQENGREEEGDSQYYKPNYAVEQGQLHTEGNRTSDQANVTSVTTGAWQKSNQNRFRVIQMERTGNGLEPEREEKAKQGKEEKTKPGEEEKAKQGKEKKTKPGREEKTKPEKTKPKKEEKTKPGREEKTKSGVKQTSTNKVLTNKTRNK